MKKIIVSLAAMGAITLLSACTGMAARDAGRSGSGNSMDGAITGQPAGSTAKTGSGNTQNGANLEITPRDADGDGLPNSRDARPKTPKLEGLAK